MAELYLLPENVSPTHAAQVLEFLNAVASADELAAAVEIPYELDIGPRVAARILARRDQLGGFTSLEQVYAVPYVGPERFTELVTSLSGARPPPAFDEQVDRALLTQITQRLNSLEAQLRVAATIKLTALNPDAWLGQEIVLLAEVKDGRGKPLVDQPVTFVTTWGRLRGRAGVQPVAGNSVTVRTDHLGLCKLHLSASLGEGLTQADQASLSAALSVLGSGSSVPRDSLPALTELARRYRAVGNDALRHAIDAYYRRYGSPEGADGPLDSLARWPRIEVTVLAYLTPAPDTLTAQLPTGLVNVRQRNWFYAWTWAYRQLLQEETTLLASLGDVSGVERSSSGILTDLFGRIGTFVRGQEGLVGQLVGKDFAEASLNDFLQSGLAKLPVQERTAVFTGVTAGAKSLAGGSKLFAALEGSRVDLSSKIDTGLAGVDSSVELGQIEGRLTQIETNAVMQADLAGLQDSILAQAALDTSNQLAQFETEVNANLATKADTTQITALSQQVLQLQNQDTVLKDSLASTNAKLDAKADATQLTALNQQVLDLQSQSRTFSNSLTTVNSRLKSVDTSISDLRVRVRGAP